MNPTPVVAILGSTGVVGEELRQLLAERAFPYSEIRLLASPRSAGRTLRVGDEEITVQAVSESAFDGVDIAFFSAGGSVSQQWAPVAIGQGAVIIDNTSAFRLRPDVPLVVPEVNGPEALNHQGIIANPNCSTIIMVMALKPLHDFAGIKRVVVSTYQAVSGGGAQAMQELIDQVNAFVAGTPIEASVLPVGSGDRHYQVAFNLLPQIDLFEDQDYTREEWKMVRETRKILKDDHMAITATTVRVPVLRSHSESINIETHRPISVDEARKALAGFPGVVVHDDPASQQYPMPLDATGQDPVFVGRIRKDDTVPHGLNLWVVGDQIRKGAALNAVQIAEYLVNHA